MSAALGACATYIPVTPLVPSPKETLVPVGALASPKVLAEQSKADAVQVGSAVTPSPSAIPVCVGDIQLGKEGQEALLVHGPGGTEVPAGLCGLAAGWEGCAMPRTPLLPRSHCVPLTQLVKSPPGNWVRVTRLLLELLVP